MDEFDEIPDLIGLFETENTPEKCEQNSDHTSETMFDIETNDKENNDKVNDPSKKKSVVPLTILTGWLGSGKTTLLHHILESLSNEGKTVAILQNETSELMGVEKALKIQDDSGVFGEVLEVKNGCICCSVRSDFMLAIDVLLTDRHFDHVVVECSGMADVGQLATQLWVDDDLESKVYLDGVVCVVDANHIYQHMGWNKKQYTSKHSRTLCNQILYADRILINKMDTLPTLSESQPPPSLVSDYDLSYLPASLTVPPENIEYLNDLANRVRHINPLAPMALTVRSNVDLDYIFHIKALRLNRGVEEAQQITMEHANAAVASPASKMGLDTVVSLTAPAPLDTIHGIEVYSNFPLISKNTQSDGVDGGDGGNGGDGSTEEHDHGITTIVLRKDCGVNGENGLDLEKFKRWMIRLLWEGKQDDSVVSWQKLRERLRSGDTDVDDREEEEDSRIIYRLKGVLSVRGEKCKYYLQGVLETFDVAIADSTVGIDVVDTDKAQLYDDVRVDHVAPEHMWSEGENRYCSIIVIGTGINVEEMCLHFSECFQ